MLFRLTSLVHAQIPIHKGHIIVKNDELISAIAFIKLLIFKMNMFSRYVFNKKFVQDIENITDDECIEYENFINAFQKFFYKYCLKKGISHENVLEVMRKSYSHVHINKFLKDMPALFEQIEKISFSVENKSCDKVTLNSKNKKMTRPFWHDFWYSYQVPEILTLYAKAYTQEQNEELNHYKIKKNNFVSLLRILKLYIDSTAEIISYEIKTGKRKNSAQNLFSVMRWPFLYEPIPRFWKILQDYVSENQDNYDIEAFFMAMYANKEIYSYDTGFLYLIKKINLQYMRRDDGISVDNIYISEFDNLMDFIDKSIQNDNAMSVLDKIKKNNILKEFASHQILYEYDSKYRNGIKKSSNRIIF